MMCTYDEKTKELTDLLEEYATKVFKLDNDRDITNFTDGYFEAIFNGHNSKHDWDHILQRYINYLENKLEFLKEKEYI